MNSKSLRRARNLQVWILSALLITGGAAAAIIIATVRGGYDELLTRSLSGTQDQARVIQVTFKKQVQDWKDILIRGRDYQQFQKYVGQFHDEEAKAQKAASTLRAELAGDPDGTRLIDAFITAHTTLSTNYAAALKVFEASRGADYQGTDALVKGQDRAPTDTLDQLVTHLSEGLEQGRVGLATFVRRAEWIGGLTALVVVLGLGGLLVWTMASVTQSIATVTEGLHDGVEQVASASGQVSISAQSLSQGATEQAASLEETSASMEEMSSMTRRNAENSQNAARLMLEVEQRVGQSTDALGTMIASMGAIQESSNKVAKIIKTIDEIAFQTNILALNAAVEAARAGEVGMGFAVVADEVRNLAQRSAQAARDTQTLIEESIANSKSGAARVQHVEAAIGSIAESVSRVKGLVDEVSESSRQQAQGIGQVSQAIAQMEKVTQTTAATAEESAAASEELNAQAETSRELVSQLRVLAGHRTADATRVPRIHRTVNGASTPAGVGRIERADEVMPLPLAPTGTDGF
jgi:hypothetical protein